MNTTDFEMKRNIDSLIRMAAYAIRIKKINEKKGKEEK